MCFAIRSKSRSWWISPNPDSTQKVPISDAHTAVLTPGRQSDTFSRAGRSTARGDSMHRHFFILVACLGLGAGALPVEPSTAAEPARVVLVAGTASTPNAAEQRYSKNTARRMARWLADAGIAHRESDDDGVIAGSLGGASVAILPYNPTPPQRELIRLDAFVRRGGKLIVCYGADPTLARIMGLQLGSYSAAPGQRTGFRFLEPAPAGVPLRVAQASNNIRPAYPADDRGRVIAVWEDAARRPTRDPAWTQSPAGLWMSHILLDDDSRAKGRMLLGLVALCDPAAWRSAAARYRAFDGAFGSFASFADASRAISSQAAGSGSADSAGPLLSAAGSAYAGFQQLCAAGRYAAAIPAAQRAQDLLGQAYGAAQPPRTRELRGVWDSSGRGLYPGDWNRTCRLLAGHGVTAIFPNVARGGTAHYASRLLQPSDIAQADGDQLAACVAASQKFGLDVHAWVFCWNMDGADAGELARLRREGRLQVNAQGTTLNWLCPSHPANRARQLGVISEIASGYDVDGIHLDYIRYPGSDACFCATCRAQFQADIGQTVSGWPASVRSGRLAPRFRQWRRERISLFVARAAAQIREIHPGIRLSAAVYGFYPGCADSIGQDWGTWMARGDLDFACPMDYTESLTEFRSWLDRQSAIPGGRPRIYPGLGVTAAESHLDPIQTIDQIRALRNAGFPGFVLFDLSRTLEDETLPALSLGISRSSP